MAHQGSAGALAVLLSMLATLTHAGSSSRIREQPIRLKTVDLLGVPVVDPPKRSSGYFKLNRTEEAEMFYFLFESRGDPSSDPVVLWMTGGPGCSSELAVLYENGPYSLNKDMTLTESEFGWDKYHTMIFVDQPIGTGFSYSNDERDTVFDEHGVAEDMLDFLQEFFEVHPELADNEFYVTGESYAGHYVPAVSHRVWKARKDNEGKPINFKGLAIGNGLTNPSIQYGAYADYAAENDLIPGIMQFEINFFFPICRFAANMCDKTKSEFVCYLSLVVCQGLTFGQVMGVQPNINVYDITKTCDFPLCYDFSAADKFLNMPATREALGVGDRDWQSCNMDVHWNLMGDWMRNFDTVLPEMLADGVRMAIYAGELDLICNYLGNKRWVSALPWDGNERWNEAAEEEWSSDGVRAGSVQSYGPLSFIRVGKAGHMVPMDQPVNALAMITAFTRDKDLTSALRHVNLHMDRHQGQQRSAAHGALDLVAIRQEERPDLHRNVANKDRMQHIHAGSHE